MLFGYPRTATEDNWLHECLFEILQSIHISLQAEQVPLAWPDIIPERYRGRLSTRRGLRERLSTYQTTIEALTSAERDRVLRALNNQNEIEQLLSCGVDCEPISNLPQSTWRPVKELFEFAFGLLTDLGIRDRQYSIIYHAVRYQVCPFCGCEFFDAPGAPREHLDHYLSESRYPFAAVNLCNLVPMGSKCNSSYKLAQDILWCDDGTRRRSFYPYSDTGLKISLQNSELFAGIDRQVPRWQIDFEPDNAEALTWDEVFHIRERYTRDVLNPSFKGWLESFGPWFRKNIRITPITDADLVMAIERYVGDLELMGLRGREFLRVHVFQMLHRHCQQGDQRLLELVRDIAAGSIV